VSFFGDSGVLKKPLPAAAGAWIPKYRVIRVQDRHKEIKKLLKRSQ
jgi:hypothetical protein